MYSFEHAPQAGCRQYDHVIEALAPDGSNEAFDVGVLPRRARRRQDFPNANRLHMIERMIPIAKDIARQLVPGKRVTKLLRGPRSRRMFRHREMHHASPIMSEEHQDEQQPARRRRHNEEVGCDELLCMVGQERPPGLGGEGPVANHVCGDGRLRDRESEFQQPPVDPSRAPERIRG